MQIETATRAPESSRDLCRRHAVPMAAAGGAIVAAMAWRWGITPVLPAGVYLAAVGTVLAVIDLSTLRLPDRIVLPSLPIAAGLLGAAAIVGAGGGSFGRALLAAASAFVAYLVLALINPAGLGFGDVKLAGFLGLYLGWFGWPVVFWGLAAPFVLVALVGAALMLTGRADRKSEIPFGPFMVAGTLLAILL